ncbi:MAG TPA: PASTA domain-containing protein, partial [Naasia sp.]
LTKDKHARFQTAAEFRDDVHTAASGRTPERRLPSSDPGATLFGAASDGGMNPALKQLAMDDDTVVRTQTRPPAVWIWAGILSVLVIIVSVVIWVVSLSPSDQLPDLSREVPDLQGSSYDAAVEALEERDLVATQHFENSANIPKDQVVRTVPEAGTVVQTDQEIDIYVSTGPAQSGVPNLVNLSQAAAIDGLKLAEFTVGSVLSEHSPDVPDGVVLRTDPVAGTQLEKGATVNLVVSDGLVEVPDVRNLPLGEARGILEGAALKLRVSVDRVGDCGAASDLVVTQSLAPGTVPQRSAITLTYCDGT